MSDLEPDKLKVAELRDELKVRGLDTKGNKAALVSRLKQAMGSNGGDLSGMEYTGGDDGDGDDDQARDDEEGQEEDESAQYDEDAQIDESTNDGNYQEDQEKHSQQTDEATTGDGAMEASEEANGNAEDDEPPLVLGDEFRTIDEATQDDTEEGNTDRKRKRSHDRHRRTRSRSRDRHRLNHRDRRYGSSSAAAKKIDMDDTTWESLTVFTLDRYDADLNLRFNDRGIKAHPLTVGGFAYMWSGVRANYGVRSGKVAFEVKILEHLNVDHLPREEPNPHSVRVGWSLNSTSLNLGEEPLSYGFGSTGQAATDNNFFDYGQTFGVGDVFTAYLDFESDPIVFSFSKNGEDLGKCFEVEKENLGDNALFPHLLTKNAEFECNFGAREGPYFPLKDGFKFLEEVPAEERIRGHLPPAKKEECEVIMTVGLPGSGKTFWAEKHVAEHPEKRYNILGTNSIIDKMRVLGKPRRQNHNGEWSVLIDKANKCLNRFIELAARKKRNFIIDQTNVFASSRRRKMQPFEGFQRKAVVVLPTDEVYKNRVKERSGEDRKDIPESAVNEMKASFSLPEDGEYFESIEYIEDQTKEDCDKLIEQYRKEGRDALPPPDKRFRRESREYRGERRGGYRGSFDRERSGGGYRGNNWKPFAERRGRYRGSNYRSDRFYDDGRDSYGYKGSRGYGGWRGRSSWSSSRGYGSRGYSSSGWGGGYNQSYDDDWDDYEGWGGYGQGWNSYK